jgi:hypothetical protein
MLQQCRWSFETRSLSVPQDDVGFVPKERRHPEEATQRLSRRTHIADPIPAIDAIALKREHDDTTG